MQGRSLNLSLKMELPFGQVAVWSGGRLAIGPNFSNYQELVEDAKIVWVPPPRGRPYIFAIS